MRKFRAWHDESKVMVYFDPSKYDEYIAAHFYELVHSKGLVMMQYTGMQDSKGVDIYEGDILDFHGGEWGGYLDPEVVPVITEFVSSWPLCGSPDDVSSWRTVVGHIHEIKKHMP